MIYVTIMVFGERCVIGVCRSVVFDYRNTGRGVVIVAVHRLWDDARFVFFAFPVHVRRRSVKKITKKRSNVERTKRTRASKSVENRELY